jgi:hypothetical protein
VGSGVVLLVDDAVGVTYNDGRNLLSDDEIYGLQRSVSAHILALALSCILPIEMC